MTIDLRAVRQFNVVAEELSFTRAAMRLGVAQPWLSARIRRLEADLGVPLFTRTTRRVELTEEGRALLRRAGPLVGAAEEIDTWAASLRGDAGRVRLGTPPYGANIPEQAGLVGAFHRRWPRTSLELDVGWSRVLLERLGQGALDLALTVGTTAPSGFEALTLAETSQDLLIHPDDALASAAPVTPEALKGRRVVVFTRGLNPDLFHSLFDPLAQAGATLIEVPDILDIRALLGRWGPEVVIAQFGWSARRGGGARRRIARPLAVPEGPIRLYLTRRREPPRMAARQFWALAEAGRGAPALHERRDG